MTTIPVAVGGTLWTALVALGPDEAGALRFHQRLRQHADAFPQDIAVLLPSCRVSRPFGVSLESTCRACRARWWCAVSE
jgi:hypothetical protein